MADPVKASVKLPWAKANRSTFDQNDKVGERSMKLTWKSIVDADKSTALAELKAILYTDALVIDNGRTTYAGIWRNAGSGYDGRTDEYWMVVRAGWATALAWDEVRISKADDQGPEGPPATDLTHAAVELTIIVPNVANSYSQAIIASLIGDHNNPTIQGVARAGVWTCNLATAIERPQDGCHDIQATLFIATAYQVDPKVVSITALEITTETQLFQQSNLPVFTFTQGILTVLSAQLDKFRRWRIQRRDVTSTPRIMMYTFQERANGPLVYHYLGKNDRGTGGAPSFPGFRQGYVNELVSRGGAQYQPDGTWDWYVVQRLDDAILQVGQTKNFQKYTTKMRQTRRYDVGMVPDPNQRRGEDGEPLNDEDVGLIYPVWWEKATEYSGVILKCYATLAEAWEANINGTPISKPPYKIGEGLWISEWEYNFTTTWTWDRQAD